MNPIPAPRHPLGSDTRIWDADPAVRELGCPGITAAERAMNETTARYKAMDAAKAAEQAVRE